MPTGPKGQRRPADAHRLMARLLHESRPGIGKQLSLHRQEMFTGSLAALPRCLFVQRAGSVGIRPHADHPPAPEHHWVIGLGESDKCAAILSLGRSREHQTRCGDIPKATSSRARLK